MSNNTSNTSSGGIGFAGALTILFIALKLIPNGHGSTIITWSWWWVLSPLWISAGVVIAILLIVLLIAAIVALVKN